MIAAILVQAARASSEFEAASIRPSIAESGSGSGIRTDKGRINARNVTLKRCMRGAYDVPEDQIFGGPKWIDQDRYDIIATAAGPAGDGELMIMLQALLADRFKLSFHRETKTLPGFVLLIAKAGLKAKPSAPDARSRTDSSRGRIDAEACTLAQLAMKLSAALHLPVADLTNTSGQFDFTLNWTPDEMRAKAPDAEGPSIFSALQEQLGLKLESRKMPVEVLVIDHAEPPSEN